MKLLCFGDSNTYGYDPRSYFGERYDDDVRWTGLLSHACGYEIINLGRNGREIPHTPLQFHQAAEELMAFGSRNDTVMVMLGGNDLLQEPFLTAQDIALRMERFLSYLMEQGWYSLLLVAPAPFQRGTWVTEAALIQTSHALGNAYCEVAQRLKIPFADSAAWNIERVFDGVHYSEKGHYAFAQGILQVLSSL